MKEKPGEHDLNPPHSLRKEDRIGCLWFLVTFFGVAEVILASLSSFRVRSLHRPISALGLIFVMIRVITAFRLITGFRLITVFRLI